MNSRTVAYVLAVLILVMIRLTVAKRERRKCGSPGAKEPEASPRSVWRLLLASFLVLFAELAFIRWIAVEVWIFAYFKNLALLLCFLGFGMGCALVRKPLRWSTAVKALFGILLLIRLPWYSARALEGLSQILGAAADMNLWVTNSGGNLLEFAFAAALSALLFLLMVWVFVPLGQEVVRQMNLAPRPLMAYSQNLAASLAGILPFLPANRLVVPPWVCLGRILLGLRLLRASAA